MQLNLDPSQQGEVKKGDRARITLPGNTSVTGKVDRLGRVAQVPAGQDGNAGAATIPAYVSLDDPARGTRARQGPGPGGDHDQGSGERPERPGDRARRDVRRRVRGRGRARRRATRAGRREAGPVRHREADGSRSRAIFAQATTWWCRRHERRTGAGAGRGDQGLRRGAAGVRPPRRVLSVRRGELVAIVGPSGSGKSTLLHVIGTLERPSSGVVRIGGVDAARLSDRELSRLRAREIGFVFQQFFLAEHATVRENVADGLLYAGVPAAERYRRADEALERVGLGRARDASSRPSSPEASGSGSRSPGPSSGVRRSCSPTNRPETSTAPPAHRSWSSSASSTARAPPSS